MARKKDALDYPVSKYPYVAKMPNQDPSDWRYFGSHKKAIDGLRAGVKKLGDEMKQFSSEVAENCAAIHAEIGRLPADGGSIDMLVDPMYGVRYRVSLIRREGA